MLFLLVSYSPLARRQVRASIYPVSRASAWLVVAAPAPPKPTKTREFAARQETAAKRQGVFTPAVTESETTRTCANDNGRCCNHYNKREDSHRTTLIILLKTPYAIGTIAALFLHLLLPEDRVLDEEKEHYPRAFSDGEIAYET